MKTHLRTKKEQLSFIRIRATLAGMTFLPMDKPAGGRNGRYKLVEHHKHDKVIISGLTFAQSLIKASSGEFEKLNNR
ncbi:MAG: hypothetical protein WC901_01000 [Candidatus Margulisiibacteriota bacterium]